MCIHGNRDHISVIAHHVAVRYLGHSVAMGTKHLEENNSH